MWREQLLPYVGLLLVGVLATLVLFIQVWLPLSDDLHFLLELLWIGVALGGVLIWSVSHADMPLHAPPDFEDLPPELYDGDRYWLQEHYDDHWYEE
ncbi:MAG: hypothetical protein K8L91_16830 [Anaerolineae bacterium]|nr:hypothetical protein [Anaerolineae bacterium]